MSGEAVQTLLALLVVLLAAAYVGRRAWRTMRGARARTAAEAGAGCATCGCEAGSAGAASGARRGAISRAAVTSHVDASHRAARGTTRG